jgi:hypothetical protein
MRLALPMAEWITIIDSRCFIFIVFLTYHTIPRIYPACFNRITKRGDPMNKYEPGSEVIFHPKGNISPLKSEHFTVLYTESDLVLLFNHTTRSTMWVPEGDLAPSGSKAASQVCNYFKEGFLDFKPFQSEIVMFVLASLGARAHLEDIAVKCQEVRPKLFQWDKFVYPNREKARNGLSELKGLGYAEGHNNTWWLTLDGISQTHKRHGQLSKLSGTEYAWAHEDEIKEIAEEIRGTALFSNFNTGGSLSNHSGSFHMLINCSPDMDPAIIKSKTCAFCWRASLIGDPSVGTHDDVYFDFAKACYNEYIERG